MTKIINIHFPDPNNVGDMWSSPLRFFPQLAQSASVLTVKPLASSFEVPPGYYDPLNGSELILGGGGLLDDLVFDRNIQRALGAEPSSKIAWGIGHNLHDGRVFNGYPSYLDNFDLVGLRDATAKTEDRWVPCVSALHPLLPQLKKKAAKHEIVLYLHDTFHASEVTEAISGDLPRLSNSEPDLLKVLNFLAQGDLVITSSFHGAYWATLMGRRVIVVAPFSSKFNDLAWDTPVVENPADWRSLLHEAKRLGSALDQAVEQNMKFAEGADLMALDEPLDHRMLGEHLNSLLTNGIATPPPTLFGQT